MALKNLILFIFAALTLVSTAVHAQFYPGDRHGHEGRDPGGHGGHHGPPPWQPGRPGPGPRDPEPGRGGMGYQEQKIIFVGRRVFNEQIDLRFYGGIGEYYRGYTVDSVNVNVRQSGFQSQILLVADGRVLSTSYSPFGFVTLRPYFGAKIGNDINFLTLDIRGQIDIDTITVNLVQGGYGGPNYPAKRFDVPLLVSKRMYGNDRIDLNNYVDLNRYRGATVESIEIEATPVYNNAMLDVVMNGYQLGATLSFDRFRTRNTVIPQNVVLSGGADLISLYNRGDLDMQKITLHLIGQ